MSLTRRRVIRRTLDSPKTEHMLVSARTGSTDEEPVLLRSMAIEDPEKRRGAGVTKEQLEALFRLDGLTFRIVQKYKEKILGAGYTLKGHTDSALAACQKLCDDIHLTSVMGQIIEDIFITGNGNGWLELGYTQSGTSIKDVKIINPKSGIDYIRDNDGNVIYDNQLRPEGYQLGGELGYPAMKWTKNTIEKGGDVVWTNPGNQDGRDRIAHFKLIGDELGISPLEPVYKAALIRLNLEDTVGHAAFRSSAITAYVGTEGDDPRNVSDEQLDTVRKELQAADQDTVWAFRRNVELGTFPVPEIVNFERIMYYFADMQSSGTGIGIALILLPLERGYRGDIEIAQEEFMDSVRLFQDILQWQIQEYLFKRLLKAKRLRPQNAPNIHLRGREPGIALSQARRLSTYARYDLLTPDPKLENWIRETEALPLLEEDEDK